MTKTSFALLLLMTPLLTLPAQDNPFNQLYDLLPTPNTYRTASGAPGPEYWQQKADYVIEIVLNDENQTISGKEQITYHNQSPDVLQYIWLQLDQNIRSINSDRHLTDQGAFSSYTTKERLGREFRQFDGGYSISSVTMYDGTPLQYSINKTMMRIDLPEHLAPGKKFTFRVSWSFPVQERAKHGGRSGYEYFAEDDNYLYTIAQFFPRMAVYSDNEGWQNKQFLGRGEFTLTFGDYDVSITVPADHLVAATGTLQNAKEVLTKEQLNRFERARSSFEKPVLIVTENEAITNEQNKVTDLKTWRFKAQNVRDFAFASSRKFIWDAMAVKSGDNTVMAMSMYPKEGNPLWGRYSTKVIAHTLKWYSHYTFPYPYPVAWSIHSNRIGMEYPMICFNGGRPNADGTYSERTKYGMISVIIHEIGHFYFPMIVNSDERQWTWMDEGLNTFLQFLTEQQWERDYPSSRGPAHKIVNYMMTDKERLSPIMTNSESLWSFGNNAYAKPATALNILRESIMGRELFDHAFKTYAQRWKFKHPSPADFFRTMEDASAVDLDWFWRGWFFTTDHVDLAIDSIRWFVSDTAGLNAIQSAEFEEYLEVNPNGISSERNRISIEHTQDEIDSTLRDDITEERFQKYLDADAYKEYLKKQDSIKTITLPEGPYYYELSFSNQGGLVMPLIIQCIYSDGSKEVIRIPAEIWRRNANHVSKLLKTDKMIYRVILDPFLETADTDTSNNTFPPEGELNRFQLFKQQMERQGSRSGRS